jgi:O-antigen/teichoic acid export membrane protein
MQASKWLQDFRRRIRGQATLGRYAGASIALQVANAACGFIILRWLTPETMGLWQAFVLFGTYAHFLQGGVIHGLNRELPFVTGKGDTAAILEYAGTAQVVALAVAGLFLTFVPAAWLFVSTDSERWAATAVLIGIGAHVVRLFLGATYRAAQAFESLARIVMVEAVAAVLTLPLVLYLGLAGLAIRHVTVALLGLVMNYRFRPIRQVGPFRWTRLGTLVATGLPIFAFGYLSDVARSLPRLVLLHLGGVLWLGLFAPASAVVGALTMIPGALGTYVYPQMTHRFGKTGDRSSLWPMARATALWPLVIGVPVAGLLVVLMPWVIDQFAPAYRASIPATQWIVGAGAFMGASVAVNALASLKAYRFMAAFVLCRFVLLGLFPWLGSRVLGGVTGVAAGMTAAYALDFVVVLAITRAATRPLSQQ